MRSHVRLPRHAGLLALLGVLFMAGDALAYVGPMPGPELVGFFFSLLSWLALVFSSILLWPLYALLRFWRKVPRTGGDLPNAQPAESPVVVKPGPSPAQVS